ncbi:MAG: preprotein translocase subunit SecG [Patescibacteria group bacterium]
MHILTIAQIIVSILIIGLILMQERSSDISGLLGGGDSGGFYRTRRGLERVAFGATLALVAIFAVISLVTLAR